MGRKLQNAQNSTRKSNKSIKNRRNNKLGGKEAPGQAEKRKAKQNSCVKFKNKYEA